MEPEFQTKQISQIIGWDARHFVSLQVRLEQVLFKVSLIGMCEVGKVFLKKQQLFNLYAEMFKCLA